MQHLYNIVLIGPPGSGKGTQANILAEKYNFEILGAGDLLRYEVSKETEIGRKIKDILSKGDLVSSELIVNLVKQSLLKRGKNNNIFDGIPRTLEQANLLDDVLQEIHQKIDCILHLKTLDAQELKTRILHRGQSRSDDNSSVLKNRIKVHGQNETQILNYYKEQGVKICTIDANQTKQEVAYDIEKCINYILDKKGEI